MDGTERVTLRLPTDMVVLLKSMVDSGQYSDLSEAVRDAIDLFLKTNLTVEDMIRLRNETSLDDSLDELTSSQDDVDDAIKDAVRSYLNRRIR